MEERLAQGGGGCRGGGGGAEATGAVYPGALVAPSSGLLAVARAVAARGQDGCLGSARPAAWLAASPATGQQEAWQGRAGARTGAISGARTFVRCAPRCARLLLQVLCLNLVAQHVCRRGRRPGGRTPCILICPNTAPTSPERQLKRGLEKKRRQQIFTQII